MRKILAVGVVFLLGSLIIGLTWIAPLANRDGSDGGTAPSAEPADYRVDEPNGTVVNVDLVAEETTQEIADGVTYHAWTFNGTTPGPVVRVQLGDTIRFTLTNDSSIGMQHSIDFHAALTPWADLPTEEGATLEGNYQPVDPGETKTFDFVALYPGAFLYHCGVPPVLQHIANGMYGAIIVEPSDLPAEREFVLVSSELYPGAKPFDGVFEGDLDRMLAVDPEYVVFNGKANQYLAAPLQVKPDERFRIWVVNAGPTLTNAFHVIGTLFPETYPDGNPANALYGIQTWNVPPGGGAMFELQIPDAGLYPFVTHSFAYTGLGAVGLIQVDPDAPAAPESYPTLGDPFTAGVTAFSGGGAPSPTPIPSPTPTAEPSPSDGGGTAGAELSIMAMNNVFDTDSLSAPAGTPFTVLLDNMDAGIPHNFSIYTDDTATTALFTGEIITGPDTITNEIPALDAGSYFFRCDVHPTTMIGTLTVE